MIRRIIHISDLHIPNDVHKRPYMQMIETGLKQIHDNIKDLTPDEVRIVIVGDVFHQKIKVSNEAMSVFHNTLNYLNNMCTTYIIAGNHDLIESNKDRLDSISPTFDIINSYENIIYLDRALDYKSGCLKDDNVIWALYSIFDNYKTPQIENKDENNIVIGLFHGNLSGASTDTGYVVEDGISYNSFDMCDCVMAGHIHKFQELKKNGIKAVYSSSFFQQNYGENITQHGFTVWDTETLNYTFVEVENAYRYIKFKISSYDDIANNKEKMINL